MLGRFALFIALIVPLRAETVARQAAITGGRGPGQCRIEVSVDSTAELNIYGDTAHLTTLAGQPAYWRSFRCNAPLPGRPHDFRLAIAKGRGQVRLIREPQYNRGAAVIQISDPKGGRADYAIDIVWRGGDGWQAPAPPHAPSPGNGGAIQNVIRLCQEAVTDRLNRDGYRYITFERTGHDQGPGPNDWISGTATAKRGQASRHFSFSCSVDFRSGKIRFVDVRRR